MALPNKLLNARITGTSVVSDFPARLSELENALADIFGVPLDIDVVAALLTVASVGLQKVHLQDTFGDPTTLGHIARNANALKYFDTAVRTILHSGNRQLKIKPNNENHGLTSSQPDNDLFVPLEANSIYDIHLKLIFAPASATSLVVFFAGPTGCNFTWSVSGVLADGSSFLGGRNIGNTITTFPSSAINSIIIDGVAATGAAAGDFGLHWAPSTVVLMTMFATSLIRADKAF